MEDGADVTGEGHKEGQRAGQSKGQFESVMEGGADAKSIMGKWSTGMGHWWVIILENTWSGEMVGRKERANGHVGLGATDVRT